MSLRILRLHSCTDPRAIRIGHCRCSTKYAGFFPFTFNITSDTSYVTAAGGSTNPDTNALLYNALKKARENGVPKANIENALAKVLFVPSIMLLSLDSQNFTGERRQN